MRARAQGRMGTGKITAETPRRPDAETRRRGDAENACLPASPRPPVPASPRPRVSVSFRRGVTLLEVLISIFVILIGMLGVAAVIPAGRAELVEAAKADRSSACGASAVQFLLTSGYFDSRGSRWIYYGGSGYQYVVSANGSLPGSGAIPFSDAFVVDPLYYAREAALGITTNLAFSIPAGGGPTVRATYPATPTSLTPLPQPIAERFFLCQDDLVIPVPKDKSERPRQFMTDSSATPKNVAVPTHPADQVVSSGTYYVRQVQGDYSWLFTMNPVAAQPDVVGPPAYLNVGVGEYYSVSAAVFYKRALPTPTDSGEPVGQANFLSIPGLGGGDVTLTAASPASLDVKQNEWILLGGYTSPNAADPTRRYVLRWYRIVALGDIVAGPSRQATLAGPDWDLTTPADVVLYRGVVDVHTTTMKLTD